MLKSKLMALGLIAGVTITLSACGGIPTCNDELDECTYGGPYTEERTIEAGKRMPEPAPAPMPEPAPAPVAQPAPAPTPAPVVNDAPIMKSAEPQFKQISK